MEIEPTSVPGGGAGTVSYLMVISSQATLLRAEAELLTRRMADSVMLMEALGGGWDASQLPR